MSLFPTVSIQEEEEEKPLGLGAIKPESTSTIYKGLATTEIGEKVIDWGTEEIVKPAIRLGAMLTYGGAYFAATNKEKSVEGLGRITPPTTFKQAAEDIADVLTVAAVSEVGLYGAAKLTTTTGVKALSTATSKLGLAETLSASGQTFSKLLSKTTAKDLAKTGLYWGSEGGLSAYGDGATIEESAANFLLTGTLAAGLHFSIASVAKGVEKIRFKDVTVGAQDALNAFRGYRTGNSSIITPEGSQAVANTMKHKQAFLELAEKTKAEGGFVEGITIKTKREWVGWFKELLEWIPAKNQTGTVTKFITEAEGITPETAPALLEKAIEIVGGRTVPVLSKIFGENRLTSLYPKMPEGMTDPGKFAQLQQGIYSDAEGAVEIPEQDIWNIEAKISKENYETEHGAFMDELSVNMGTYKKVIKGLDNMNLTEALSQAKAKMKVKPSKTLEKFIKKYDGLEAKIAEEFGEGAPTAVEVFEKAKQRWISRKQPESTLPLEKEYKKWVDDKIKARIADVSGTVTVKDIMEGVRVGEMKNVREKTLMKLKAEGKAVGARTGYVAGKRAGAKAERTRKSQIEINARANREMMHKVNKLKKDIKGINTSGMLNRYKTQIDKIKNSVDLTAMTEKKKLELEATREFFKDHPGAFLPEASIKALERLDKKSIKDLTLDDLQDLRDALKQIEHLDKMSKKMTFSLQGQNIDKIEATASANLEASGKKTKQVEEGFSTRKKAKTNLAKNFDYYRLNIEYLTEKVDGHDGGIQMEVFYKGADKGEDIRIETKDEFVGALKSVMTENGVERSWSENGYLWRTSAKIFRKMAKRTDVEWVEVTLPDFGKLELTRGERIDLFRTMMDKDGLKHILNGGIVSRSHKAGMIGKSEGRKLTMRDVQAFQDGLTEGEKAVGLQLQDAIYDPLYDKINTVIERLSAKSLDKKPNYNPIRTLSDVKKTLWHDQTIQAKDWLESASFTQKRTEGTGPVYIDDAFGKAYNHIQSSSKFIGYVEPLRDMKLLLSRSTYRKKVQDTWGDEMLKELDRYVSDLEIINRDKSKTSKAVDHLKNRIATAYMMSPSVALKQILSRMLGTTEMPAEWLKQGLKRFRSNPQEVIEFWMEKSPQIRERLQSGFDREISEVNSDLAVTRDLFDTESLASKGMGMIKWGDSRGVMPNLEGVRWAAEQGLISEADMVKKGEEVIRRTQPAFATKDLPASLRDSNPILRLFTMFTTFLNKVNIISHRMKDRVVSGELRGKELGRQVGVLLWSTIIGTTLVNQLNSYVKNFAKDDKYEPDPLWEGMALTTAKMPFSVTQTAFIFDPMIDKVAGKWWAKEGLETPADDIIEMAQLTGMAWWDVAKETYKNEGDAIDALVTAIDETTRTTVILEGLPYDNIKAYGGTLIRTLSKIAEIGIDAALGQPSKSGFSNAPNMKKESINITSRPSL
jgi:hypothetical protein